MGADLSQHPVAPGARRAPRRRLRPADQARNEGNRTTTESAPAVAVVCGAPIRGGTSLHHEAGQPEPLDEIVRVLI